MTQFLIYDALEKSGGPYIGPRGGKWADSQHTVPWVDTKNGNASIPKAQQVYDDNEYLYDLDPHLLKFTESGQDPSHIDNVNMDDPILATLIRGNYVVLDGHHRTLNARKNNKPVRALVIPESDYRGFKKEGIHQADMKRAFVHLVIERRKIVKSLSFKNWMGKSGGPFLGPRGGKWADPDHKIPWKETGPERTKKVETDKPERTTKQGEEDTSKPVKEEDSKGERADGEAKYTKRVPYTDKDGKRKYRYYYNESAAARDVQEGENIKLGKQLATVNKVEADGTINITVGDANISVKPGQWDKLLSKHYGDAYFKWAEKRAQQSVNAVLKHVPKEELADLKGNTDEERFEDLKSRVPSVYEKLKQSFSRVGINPFRAKQILSASLERKGWEPEARAAVIGDVLTGRNRNYQTAIRAAENLAGGGPVKVGHVGAVAEIVKIAENEEKDEIAEVAAAAEKELARLSELLSRVKGGDKKSGADALAAALSSTAMQKLNLIAKAFPGLADRAVGPTRKILEEVPSVVTSAKPKSEGSDTVVFVAGEGGNAKSLDAKYKLVEAEDAIASHDPSSGFKKRSDYPGDIQERAYHRDKSEQAKVIRNAQKFRPEFVINTNPDAVNGAPVMGPDGVVLGGNSRTMSMQLAYANHPEKAKEIRDYLVANAHQAGFTKEDVAQFKNPILVRVLENGGETPQEKRLLVRQMNESFTQAMDPRTMQVAMGRKLSDNTIAEIGKMMDPDETLNAFLGSNRAESFINALQKEGIIDQRNSNQYFLKGTKKLNQDGQTLVARILVGRVIGDADLLSATKASLVDNLAKSVPYMAQAKAYGDNYDLSEDVKTALDAYNSLQYRVDTGAIPALKADMTAERFDGLFAQQEMFGGAHPVTNNKRALSLLEILIRKPGSTQITDVFKEYAEQARQNPEGQTSMFGASKTPTEIFTEVAAKYLPKPKKEAQGSLLLSDARFVLFGHGDDFDALKKSWGGLSKSLLSNIAAETGHAGNRAPGPGLGVNYVIFPPKKKKGTGYTPSAKEMVSRGDEDDDSKAIGALHAKKEDYEFQDRDRRVRPYIYPEQYKEAHRDARKGSKKRMDDVKRKSIDNILLPKNKVEVAR